MTTTLTYFQGRAGDHNDLAIPGALALAKWLSDITGLNPVSVGEPAPALNTGWSSELTAAMPDLKKMKAHMESVFTHGGRSLAATSRCAVSLATLPALAKYRPDACIVWFDSHADLNTPSSTESGYLGGLALSGPTGLWDSGLGSGFSLASVILVGQRDLDAFEKKCIAENSVAYIPLGDNYLEQLRQNINGRPVYIHLDCDVMEPGIVPTDYVHPQGMTLNDLEQACSLLAESTIIGLEIAEFQNAWTPDSDPVSPSELINALLPVINKIVKPN
ncbi:arginase family protein [Enterobacter sp. RHBSTW-00994]|uniref:arginase family protein n=1 Tax=Enterobacter sp. RHBSTW-00994 TaxID=2742676 RepID=UPI0015E9A422|nr:arginase family protein [Enterobacter sp. RHBSTW-00994]QLR43252.1 arginase family protein [Enterobacter sp. RHBSTW-00994]